MKKLLMLFVLIIVGVMMVGCTESRDADIPVESPSYLAVYNAGTIIYEAYATDGAITIKAQKTKVTTVSIGDTSEYWLVYHITQNGVTTKIVDSDSLSILWRP